MANIEHKTLGYVEQHVIHFKEYANAAARTGAVGLTEYDDYKVALQLDDHSYWILTDYSGPTWVCLGLQPDGAITAAKLAANAVETAKIKDANVTEEKLAAGVGIPSGTKMYFYQNTAPTGWTIDGACADALLAVKGGAQAYNVNGGNQAGSWTLAGLTADAHKHDLPFLQYSGGIRTHSTAPFGTGADLGCSEVSESGDSSVTRPAYRSDTATTNGITSDASHRPLAQVGIIATKD